MSFKAFRKIQVSNVEGTPGTAEAATEILYGVLIPPGPGIEVYWPEEDRASLAKYMADDLIVSKMQPLVWSGVLNHRHVPWLACMAIRGNITPTQPDVTNEPNAYLWSVAPGLTTANTPDIANGVDTFTFEYGDNTQAYETPYTLCQRLQISGTANGMVEFTANLFGTTQADTTFTGALTAQSVQRFTFNEAKVYFDGTWANLGTTQKTGLVRAFTWTLDTMFRPWHTADGTLYHSAVVEDRKAPELSLTMRRGTDSDTQRGYHEARTTTFIRIELLGKTELDNGQSNPPYVRIDGAYRYAVWPDVGEDEGAAVEQPTARGVYDATGAKMYQWDILTDLDAYPGV